MRSLIWFSLCCLTACGQGLEENTPRMAEHIDAIACETSDDCRPDELCVGKMGCDSTWTCVPEATTLCTLDVAIFCACDGTTIQGSRTCIGEKVAYMGACD